MILKNRISVLRIGCLIVILFWFNSCKKSSKFDLPDQITTTKTTNHIRLPGTRIFVGRENGLEMDKMTSSYLQRNVLFIKFVQYNNLSFNEAKSGYNKSAFLAKGTPVDTTRNIKINGYDAVYIEGPSKTRGEIQRMIIFGDNTFLAVLRGVCKKSDPASNEVISRVFRSIFYDKNQEMDPLETALYDLDLSITHFKFAFTASNFLIYTPNGKEDSKNPFAASIQIASMPSSTLESAQKFSDELRKQFEKNGIKFLKRDVEKTKINGYNAVIIESKIKSNDKEGILYETILLGTKSTVIFIGNAYDAHDDYLNQFKKTAETIRIKIDEDMNDL